MCTAVRIVLCLPCGLIVSSFCWSINWTYYRTDRTSRQRPCHLGLGLRPELMLVNISSYFLVLLFSSFSLCFFPFFFVFFLGCKYVLWIRSWYYFVACDTGWYTIARYSTAPLGITTAVHALFRFLSRRFSYLVSVLFFHGLDFRQMS